MSRGASSTAIIIALLLTVAATASRAAIVAGQVDDFQNNSTSGWGGGDNLTIVDGGPSGAGDLYLHFESFGGGSSGSKLSSFNTMQWSGDYAAAGVTSISMDFLNPNTLPVATPLNMRIVLIGPNGSRWSSTTGVVVPADN